jgi:hypothetical protein
VFNNQLFAFWKANDTSNRIFVSGSSTGAPNSSPAGKVINGSDSTSAAPAACVFNNQLFVFWKSDDPSNRIFVSAGPINYRPHRDAGSRGSKHDVISVCG